LRRAREDDLADFADIYDDFERHYGQRIAGLTGETVAPDHARGHARYRTLMHEVLRVERETVVRLRNNGTIGDEALRNIERELDLSETRLSLT
jgi:hypothetical protein